MTVFLYNLVFNKTLELHDGKCQIIEAENSLLFSKLINSLKNDCLSEREIAIYVDDKELIGGKDYQIIIDYYDYETINKSIITKLIKHISDYYKNDVEVKINLAALSGKLNAYVLNLLQDFDISFQIKEKIEIEDILKFFDISPVINVNDLFEKYIEMINIVSELNLYSLLVFVNASSFFTDCQLFEIKKMLSYKNCKAIFIENKISNKPYSVYDEVLTIDEDLFDKITKI